ncbi:MAG: 4-alpha-glucanotransferase [Clostridia bacterium]|nr:4-alpha-glucanotransferase [Clostridia bacterium]
MKERKAGILLPVFSLWGEYGIGSMGREARAFLRSVKNAGFKVWQVLPLTPTGYGDSPYQAECGYAGNPYFIDLPTLKKQGLLTEEELLSARVENTGRVDYAWLYETRLNLLKKAFSRFVPTPEYRKFAAQKKFRDYALFAALKAEKHGLPWYDWEAELRFRRPLALRLARNRNRQQINFYLFVQYEFFRQWYSLKEYANGLGVQILGDLPLYLSRDSVEGWVHPELFLLGENRAPELVAGVPPDYFDENGQLWGNPVYDWASQAKTGYRWWRNRIRDNLTLFDMLRIDHFRGLDRYYAVPANAENAKNGKWYDGPKTALFRGMKSAPIVAEDLGTSDDSLVAFLKKSGYPGMRVLSFMFDGDPKNPHLISNHAINSVVYTGTHDNQPLLQLYLQGDSKERAAMRKILAAQCKKRGISCEKGGSGKALVHRANALLLNSRSRLAILPFFDVLARADLRVNTPGASDGNNWTARLKKTDWKSAYLRRVKAEIENSGR